MSTIDIPERGRSVHMPSREGVFSRAVGTAGAGLALGSALGACGGDAGGEAASPAATESGAGPKAGGELRVGTVGGSAKDTADPQNATTSTDAAIQFAMYDILIGWTPEYKQESHLPEEVTPDAKVWTVRLKPDLTWHDGKPVSANDIVFTFQRICDPKAPLPSASSLGGLTPGGVVNVKVGEGIR